MFEHFVPPEALVVLTVIALTSLATDVGDELTEPQASSVERAFTYLHWFRSLGWNGVPSPF
ncbi:hypothetical protein [Streptomyces adustus]|uniref:hypothetical protein n=1 Tax=Streptomyces adustus TaxID=1609272 RepID=UPI00371153D2